MAVKYINNAEAIVTGSLTSTDTSITVDDASKFPTLAAGDLIYLTLSNISNTVHEIVICSGITGNVLTVTRGQDNTTALDWTAGDTKLSCRLTAGLLNLLLDQRALLDGDVVFNSVQLSGGTGTQGTLSWNIEDQTLDLAVSPDVTYQIGQELGVVAKNISGVTLANGAVVRVTGASGDKITVDLADNSAELGSSETFAIVTEDINSNATGHITTNGIVRGLDTSTYAEGAALWLGTSGSFTTTKPLTPAHLVHIGWVVRSHATEGIILVRISNGWEVEELHDVLITDNTAGELLKWDGSKWINNTLAEAGIQSVLSEGAFVDGDKTKLDGIEDGADVTDTANVTAAGALMDSEVTNLAAVKAFDPADYATAAQGTLADSALQSSDIGVSVQAYNANTVVDSSYVHTDNNYTTTEKNKLAGIESGATADQSAAEVPYTNTTSGLTATNVQAAVDEVDGRVDTLEGVSHTHSNKAVLDATTASFTTADETKLDGIEAGATADQTASEILTAIKTVDGAGSGLSADNVDGVHLSGLTQSGDAGDGDLNNSYWEDASRLTSSNVTANGPGTGWYTIYNNRHRGGTGDGTNYGSQIAIGMTTDTDNMYFRSNTSADNWTAWHKTWNDSNDGAGSGLDADLLDGQHGSYYTQYTDTAIANLVDSSPATLDTLNELAAALGDDPNFATTVATNIGTKVSKSGDIMTGDLYISMPAATLGLGSGSYAGPHGIEFYDAASTVGIKQLYRTTPQTLSWELSTDSILMSLDKSGNLAVAGTVDGVDIGNSINQDVRTTASPTFAGLTVTDKLQVDRPSTHWTNSDYYDVAGLGQLSTEGSYEVTLTSNGYRNSSGTWTGLNAGTFGGAAQIRLNPQGKIHFGTDTTKADGSYQYTTPRMTLTDTGLGIGTTTPTSGYKLDVNGAAIVSGQFAVDTDTLLVRADTDRVGINTATPQARLHVSDTSTANDDHMVRISSFRPSIVLEDFSGTPYDPDFQIRADLGNLSIRSGDATTNTLLANELITVKSDGNVGINNTSPAERLQVGGNISLSGNILVTGTVDGRDIATDGSKLDGIEAGATADQTASEILTAIKTVDGSGSGLDADKLDGVDSSGFLRSNTDDSFSGNLTGSAMMKLTKTEAGSSADAALWLSGTSGSLMMDSSGQKRIYWNDGGGNFGLRSGNYFSNSDERYVVAGDGAAEIEMSTDASDGVISMRVALKGASADDPITWSNYLTLNNTSSGAGVGGLVYNGVQVWHADNDGSGSGLDADLLDGQHASAFATASHTHSYLPLSGGTLTGALYFTPTSPSAQIADIFTAATYKSYINFNAGSGSNDPGYIMHETSSTENNEGVLHLCPSDDNSSTDYVSIHGTNDPDSIRLFTDGSVTGITKLNGGTPWHSGNDGSGSGLDADKLDGLDSSQFLRGDTADTFTTLSGTSVAVLSATFGLNDASGTNIKLGDDAYMGDINLANTVAVRGAQNSDRGYINFSLSQGNQLGAVNGGDLTWRGQKVWHAGNDGSGSGLDADLLDGQHGSYYTSYTDTAIANLVAAAPATLDTLNELAAALSDDPNFATTVTNNIATKVPLTGGANMTGEYSTTGYLIAGRGSGGVALTHNDGYGNANVTFNHVQGKPEQNGNAGRIEVNTDNTSNATMSFELKSNVVADTAVGLTPVMALYEDRVDLNNHYLNNVSYINLQNGPQLVKADTRDTLKVVTSSGYINIGPYNANYAHFITDMPKYYFDKKLVIDEGIISSYDENLVLATSSGTDQHVTITTAGMVGFGTSTPDSTVHVAGDIHANGNFTVDGSSITGDIYIPASTTEGRKLEIGTGRTANGYAYIDLIGDTTYTDYGLRVLRGSSGANADSEVTHRGTGSLNLKATDAGSVTIKTNDTPRMRVTSTGAVGIGTTSPQQRLHVYATSGEAAHIQRTSDGTALKFSSGSGTAGYISVSGTTTSYNTSSDYRLKEAIEDVTGATDRVKLLNPVNFAWKDNGKRVDGFLAHELSMVVPEAVTGEKDAVDDEGNPIYQGIDQSKLVPLLTAALQEALGRIEALEAKLNK